MIKKRWQVIVLVSIILTFLALPLVSAGVTDGKLINLWDNTVTLEFDETTLSYADGTNDNTNIFLYISSDAAATDFQDHYFILAYRVHNKAIPITVSKMFVDSATSPIELDLDLSTGKAFYPGIVSVGISNVSDFSAAYTVYYDLNMSTGLLNGNYSLTVDNDTSNIAVKIDNATDSDGNKIDTIRNYIIIGVKNKTDDANNVYDSKITYPGEEITLSHPGGEFDFIVNGLLITDFEEDELPITTGGGGGGGGAKKECNDNKDNDYDGLIDYPDDPGCDSYYDNNETDSAVPEVAGLEVWYSGDFGPEGEINEIVSPEQCVICDWPEDPSLQIPRTFWEMLVQNYIYIILGILTLILLGLLTKLMHKHHEAKKIEKNLEELNNYVKTQRSEGASDKLIKQRLVKAGWDEKVIGEFMNNNPKNK